MLPSSRTKKKTGPADSDAIPFGGYILMVKGFSLDRFTGSDGVNVRLQHTSSGWSLLLLPKLGCSRIG